jgi:hypothetical protein
MTEATKTFLDNIDAARALVEKLYARIDDHLGVDPGDVTWADVGDAARLVEMLTEAARACGVEVAS